MNLTGEALLESDLLAEHESTIALPPDNADSSQPADIANLDYLVTPMEGISGADIASALEVLDPDCAMQQWIEAAAAIKHQLGEDGYELWDQWSAKGKKYVDSDETAYRWKTLKSQPTDRRPVTIRSLFKLAIARGWVNTSLAKRGYADTAAWLRSETRSTEELLDQGTQRVAKIAPLIGNLERKSLIAALKERLHERGISVTVPDLRKEVKKLEVEAAKTSTGMPLWAKGICFVTSLGIFYRHTTDRRFAPEVIDLMYSSPPTGEEAPMRPRDYLMQIAGIPQVENFRYDPSRTGATARFFTEDNHPFVNTYRPSYPAPDPEWVDACEEIWQKHLEHLIAEPEYRLLVMDIMAYHVQFPGRKIRWAFLLQGAEGCGKTAISVVLSAACGRRNGRKLAGSDVVEGTHNDWAYGTQFVAIEEVRVIGSNRYAVMDRLKPCISDDEISLHRKYEHHVTVPNITNYLMFTNYHDSLAVNDDSRRYFVVASPMQDAASIARIGGPDYFDRLYGMVRDHPGGFRAMLERWKIDFTRFKPEGRAPMTPYLKDLAAASASPLSAAVAAVIEDQPHALVRRDLLALDCLRACLTAENVPPFTDQALASVVREAGYSRAGRHSIGGARRQLWVKGRDPATARRVAEEREELL